MDINRDRELRYEFKTCESCGREAWVPEDDGFPLCNNCDNGFKEDGD